MGVFEANEEWRDRPFILSPSPPPLPRFPYTYQKRIEINKNPSTREKKERKKKKKNRTKFLRIFSAIKRNEIHHRFSNQQQENDNRYK